MGYKESAPAVYMVAWPGLNIVKVGYSSFQRWKPFVARGGELIGVEEFEDVTAAFRREDDLAWLMAEVSRPAFTRREHAAQILGKKGSGWTECWAAPIEVGRRIFHG